ncbi:MAG: nucleoside recognition protein [Lachnospiraceae bacterium]|jgi:spore maturation protein A|nr:nucleoside recognition protein [Lachnospiraceae bacterium]
MLNYLWGIMILLGVFWGILTGRPAELTDGILTGAKDAVSLCITMAGVMAFWCGIMEVAKEAGIIKGLTRLMRPFVRFMFPGIPKGHKAEDEISTNIAANVLGLGWAATPAGLKAMEELEELEEEKRSAEAKDNGGLRRRTEMSAGRQADMGPQAVGNGRNNRKNGKGGWPGLRRPAAPKGTASNEMCTFLILNISSLQLIPVNMIAYRSQYGSVNPTAIVGPAIVATFVSTLTAVVFCKVMDRKRRV